jgi:hypothetical protein
MFSGQVRRILPHCAAGISACFSVAIVALCPCKAVVAQESAQPAPLAVPLVLRIQTNEVVLDVVARDRHNNVVADLKEDEFEVVELAKRGKGAPHRILSMRTIDPHRDESNAGRAESGFKISTGAVCALNVMTHYQLAIPASPEPGYHQVVVKTSRQDVSLSFRHRYYVGPTPGLGQAPDSTPPKGHNPTSDDTALGEAACFHPLVPPTLAITAHPTQAPGGNATRYLVVVRPESLAGIGLAAPSSKVKLDFGMCTFDATGAFVKYMKSSSDRTVSTADFDRIQANGFGTLLEIPGKEAPYLARFVVRERETGNLGIVDVARPLSVVAQGEKDKMLIRPTGSIRSFGTVTPREHTFCGDVYELSSGASTLPDFWNLDPVGSIYNDTLSVPEQDIMGAEGIPGITRNNMWFGVDYWGEFYVSEPGDYVFELQSDDGSKLEVDNQQVIDLDGVHTALVKSGHVNLAVGRHTIHVPYFQGPPTALALILRVKPPGKSMRPFNLTEYAAPKAVQ